MPYDGIARQAASVPTGSGYMLVSLPLANLSLALGAWSGKQELDVGAGVARVDRAPEGRNIGILSARVFVRDIRPVLWSGKKIRPIHGHSSHPPSTSDP